MEEESPPPPVLNVKVMDIYYRQTIHNLGRAV